MMNSTQVFSLTSYISSSMYWCVCFNITVDNFIVAALKIKWMVVPRKLYRNIIYSIYPFISSKFHFNYFISIRLQCEIDFLKLKIIINDNAMKNPTKRQKKSIKQTSQKTKELTTRGSQEPVSLTLVYVNIKQWTQINSWQNCVLVIVMCL